MRDDVRKLKGKMQCFLERLNKVAGLQYFLQVDECDLLKRRSGSSGVYSGEVIQQLAKLSKDFDE